MHLFSRPMLFLALAVMTAATANSQHRSGRYLMLGTGAVGTDAGYFRGIPQYVIEGAAGVRSKPRSAFGLVGGMLAGAAFTGPTGDDCKPNDVGGCQVSVPTMGYVGLQIGADVQRDRAGLSLSTGPTLLSVNDDGNRVGIDTRASAFVMITDRFGLALTEHHRYLNDVRTQKLTTTGATFGIRVH